MTAPSALEGASAGLPRRIELDETPFFPQEAYQCGPAALAMVLTQSGVATSPTDLVPKVYLPGRRGSLQLELIAAARTYDRLAYVIEPAMQSLLAELAGGRPVLVMQNLGLASWPVWHFAVVIGYDIEADRVVLRSGTRERLVQKTSRFARSWDLAGRWAMVLLAPGSTPATPEVSRYLTAAAGLEATGRLEAAAMSYTRATELWPEDPLARLGLANIAQTRGDYATAIQHYDEALVRDPLNVAARNNLAIALEAMGCLQAARAESDIAIRQAAGTSLAGDVAQTADRLRTLEEPGATSPVCERQTR